MDLDVVKLDDLLSLFCAFPFSHVSLVTNRLRQRAGTHQAQTLAVCLSIRRCTVRKKDQKHKSNPFYRYLFSYLLSLLSIWVRLISFLSSCHKVNLDPFSYVQGLLRHYFFFKCGNPTTQNLKTYGKH